MCVESVDLPERRHVDHVRVDPSVAPHDGDGGAAVSGRLLDPPDGAWPYFDAPAAGAMGAALDVPLVPYNSWANRGPSTMRVWLPTL
jgi:hypothetical protein